MKLAIHNGKDKQVSWNKLVYTKEYKELEDYCRSKQLFNDTILVDNTKWLEKEYKRTLAEFKEINKNIKDLELDYKNYILSRAGKEKDINNVRNLLTTLNTTLENISIFNSDFKDLKNATLRLFVNYDDNCLQSYLKNSFKTDDKEPKKLKDKIDKFKKSIPNQEVGSEV